MSFRSSVFFPFVQRGLLLGFLGLGLVACAYGQIKTQPSADVFPIDRAREDGNWTLLYRDVPLEISKDGYVIFMIPSDWAPAGLKDSDQLRLSRVIEADRSVLIFERVKR